MKGGEGGEMKGEEERERRTRGELGCGYTFEASWGFGVDLVGGVGVGVVARSKCTGGTFPVL